MPAHYYEMTQYKRKGYGTELKQKVIMLVKNMTGIFIRENITRGAAGLSYYLIMSVFPLLICVSAILGSLNLDAESLLAASRGVKPVGVMGVIDDFLKYVGGIPSTPMLIFGVAAMFTTSSAAFRVLHDIMGDIQGEPRFRGFWAMLVSVVTSVILLAAIYAAGIAVISGEWLLQILEELFDIWHVLNLWRYLRFVLLFFVLFIIVYGIYFISAPRETKRTHRLPGAVIASLALVAVSMIFSRMISASIKYTLVYGSLASFVIMMVWMYICGIILIMGNVFNVSLRAAIDGRALV